MTFLTKGTTNVDSTAVYRPTRSRTARFGEEFLKEALADVEELDFLEDTLESGRVAIPNDGISIECDGCVAIGLGGRRVRLSCG